MIAYYRIIFIRFIMVGFSLFLMLFFFCFCFCWNSTQIIIHSNIRNRNCKRMRTRFLFMFCFPSLEPNTQCSMLTAHWSVINVSIYRHKSADPNTKSDVRYYFYGSFSMDFSRLQIVQSQLNTFRCWFVCLFWCCCSYCCFCIFDFRSMQTHMFSIVQLPIDIVIAAIFYSVYAIG